MLEQMQTLKKFNHSNANKILEHLNVTDKLQIEIKKISNDLEILNFLEQQQPELAIRFLALGLPNREAIWWAYLSCIDLEGETKDAVTQQALSTIESWVKQPAEEQRRLAGKLGEQLEYYTPSSWAATAVFWSGGSIAPENKPEVVPAEFMCTTAVANAISLAAEKSADVKTFLSRALKRGLHIAMGGNGKVE